MGLRLAMAKIYVPQFIQRRKLEALFSATAAAFEVATPSIEELSYFDGLKTYARFTRAQAERVIRDGEEEKVQLRLFQNAYRIGQQFKVDFNINSSEEVMQMGFIVCKLLDIDFQGDPQGNIVIKRCLFSAYYSNKVCRLISSLDAGLLTGLSGGGKLSFRERITEGNECCRAYLQASETTR